MGPTRNFFEVFYFQFILRDLFGKIVPGLALFLAVGFSLSPSKAIATYNELSAWIWIALLSALWTIGQAIQAFGESHGWISDPPKHVHVNIALIREMIFFQIATREEKWTYDRLGSIKEACGNGYLALSLAVLLFAICSLIRALQNKLMLHVEDILFAVIITILAAGAIWYMRHMHRTYSDKLTTWIEESLRFHKPEWLNHLNDFEEKGLIGGFELEKMRAITPDDHRVVDN